LSEIDAEHENDVYHAEVRQLSRGTVLKRFVALRLEIEMFMNEKDEAVGDLSDGK
jgi:hypothetical protein